MCKDTLNISIVKTYIIGCSFIYVKLFFYMWPLYKYNDDPYVCSNKEKTWKH